MVVKFYFARGLAKLNQIFRIFDSDLESKDCFQGKLLEEAVGCSTFNPIIWKPF